MAHWVYVFPLSANHAAPVFELPQVRHALCLREPRAPASSWCSGRAATFSRARVVVRVLVRFNCLLFSDPVFPRLRI